MRKINKILPRIRLKKNWMELSRNPYWIIMELFLTKHNNGTWKNSNLKNLMTFNLVVAALVLFIFPGLLAICIFSLVIIAFPSKNLVPFLSKILLLNNTKKKKDSIANFLNLTDYLNLLIQSSIHTCWTLFYQKRVDFFYEIFHW